MKAKAPIDEAALARRDAVLRFAVGVAFSFVLCEALNWRPTGLAPVLTGVLLVNLPMRPPLKLGLVIVASMAIASVFTCLVSVLLVDTPSSLWVAVGILFFATFLAILRGAPGLPCMLMLICLAAIPVVAVASPQNVGVLPELLTKSIVIALLVTRAMHEIFPRTLPPVRPPTKVPVPRPVAIAMAATCVVMPVMLLFLLYSPTQALPAMLGTVMLTSHMDPHHGRRDAYVRVAANTFGGLLGVLAHWLLLTAPSLYTLALLAFMLAFGIGTLIVQGRWPASALVLANNGCFVIFSSAIAQGPATAGIALERVFYFSLAGLFAVAGMHLAWSWFDKPAPRPQTA